MELKHCKIMQEKNVGQTRVYKNDTLVYSQEFLSWLSKNPVHASIQNPHQKCAHVWIHLDNQPKNSCRGDLCPIYITYLMHLLPLKRERYISNRPPFFPKAIFPGMIM